MNKTQKIVLGIVLLAIFYFLGFKTSEYINNAKIEKEKFLDQQFEEYADSQKGQYVYPQEEDEEHWDISIAYTADVLTKKATGKALTEDENELILQFALQENGKGVAYTRYMEHDEGMGKATRRMWETSDGGEHWNVLDAGTYSIGYYDITYMDNIFIESSFGTTAEKGYFNISKDGGHTFESIPCEEIFDGGDKVVYPKKISEDRENKTMTYHWIDLYTQETIATVVYDLEMNVLEEKYL